MEKRIRALKAIILVVVMIVELFGVDAVRVVAETINVTGDTTISTEDNRDYAVTDCTLTIFPPDPYTVPVIFPVDET